jgi:cytochrome c556
MKKILVAVITLFLNFSVFAEGEAEFKYREGVMRTVGGHMSSLAAILRGQIHLDNLQYHARGMADLAKIVPDVFPDGSGVSKSEALPSVWEKPDEFKAAMEKFVKAANDMSAAAQGGDMSAIGPAMKALGQSCKGCHDSDSSSAVRPYRCVNNWVPN